MNYRKSFAQAGIEETGEGKCSPQITSLLDIMTILLVFLLKSFSAEGSLITPSADLKLPISSAHNTPELTTTVKITTDVILFNDTIVASNAQVEKSEDLLVKPLYERLLAEPKPPTASGDSPRSMMIQSDKEIEFSIIKRVMYTCSKAGYSNFTVLVMQEE
jgi:biopolymer transport protein ExbD